MKKFKAKVLDEIIYGDSTCFLVKSSIAEYLDSLSDEYNDFAIQRSIVKNNYLDKLFETITSNRHIPVIVLIGKFSEKHAGQVTFKNLKILDGLQRTYRLKTIFTYMKLIESNKEIVNFSQSEIRKFLRNSPVEQVDTAVFNSILAYKVAHPKFKLTDFFEEGHQWFEVWINLTVDEQINKMLILNAGQKPVSIRHQVELLFLNIYDSIVEELPQVILIRDKEKNAAAFAKNREVGTYSFSTVIAAYLSFYECEPVTLNQSLVSELQSSREEDEFTNEKISKDQVYDVIKAFLKIDKGLYKQHKDSGRDWFSRESNVSGMFAAFGKVLSEDNSSFTSLSQVVNHFIERVEHFSIASQEEIRSKIDISKVNLGSYSRKIVFRYVFHFLITDKPKKIKAEDYI